MSLDIKDYLVGSILIGVFIIALISFGIHAANENDASVSINDNDHINSIFTGVNSTIYGYGGDDSSLQEEANSTVEGFNKEDPEGSGSDGIFFSTVTAVGKSIMGITFRIFDVVWSPLLKILLPNSKEVRQVLSVMLSAIFMFLVMLLAWKLYRVGQ